MGIKLNTNPFLANNNCGCDGDILTNGEFIGNPMMDINLNNELGGQMYGGYPEGFADFSNFSNCNCPKCRRQRRNQHFCPQQCFPQPTFPIEPTPVVILSPMNGEIVTVARPTIVGRAFPNVVVNVCVDHMTCKLAMTDAQGYWRATSPVLFSGIGEHIISVSEVNKVQTDINYKEIVIQVNIP